MMMILCRHTSSPYFDNALFAVASKVLAPGPHLFYWHQLLPSTIISIVTLVAFASPRRIDQPQEETSAASQAYPVRCDNIHCRTQSMLDAVFEGRRQSFGARDAARCLEHQHSERNWINRPCHTGRCEKN